MAGEHAGHRQRMRERFLTNGLTGFAVHEILELILFYAIPQRNVNPLAHRLLERFGTLHGVLEAPAEELCKVEGVGEYAAALLSLFSHVAVAMERSRTGDRVKISNRREAQHYCRMLLGGQRREHFYVICLNAQKQVLGDVLISSGSIDEVQAYPRVAVEAALRYNAHSVILCHNHPGGSCVPSEQDVEVTRVLGELFSQLSIALLDHIIVTDAKTLSMVNCGLILTQLEADQRVVFKVADSAGGVLIRRRLETQEAMEHKA